MILNSLDWSTTLLHKGTGWDSGFQVGSSGLKKQREDNIRVEIIIKALLISSACLTIVAHIRGAKYHVYS